ncbi:MAG: spore maturation protein [Clostridia bacterium]|nr:spore maturation protein [Oscillospiraceae bacterium]MBQ7005454.1 spore maturation protein [Clostridia bacterium]
MLDKVSYWILPAVVVGTVALGLIKKIKVFDCFMQGAKKGIATVYELLPSLTGLVVAVTMLRASGALVIFADALAPVAEKLNIPSEVIPMALISPVSGGGSMSFFEQTLKDFGADSFLGQVASVLMGSTDTTLYAVTVYYAAVGIKKARHTVYAGLAADFTCFLLAPFFVRMTLY